MSAPGFIREMQENVAKYGRENTTTLLMVQAIKEIQSADAERDRLKASSAELVAACEASNQCITDLIEVYTNQSSLLILDEAVKSLRDDALKLARAALTKHRGEAP